MVTPTAKHNDDGDPEAAREPSSGSFWSAPASADGRRGGWLALAAIAALLVVNLAFNGPLENRANGGGDVLHAFKGLLVLVFAASGFAALVSAIRAVARRDRGLIVWLALLIGLAATLLMLAEFTVME